MFFTAYETGFIGRLTLVSDGDALVGCWFEKGRRDGRGAAGPLVEKADLPVFDEARGWLDRYFAGEKPAPDELRLRPYGTAFAQVVWGELRRIPYGQTVSYGEVERRVEAQTGRRACAQAVGGAVGRNPLGVIVPCHRVVGADGELTGFGGGLEAKAALLGFEGVPLEVDPGSKKETRVLLARKG